MSYGLLTALFPLLLALFVHEQNARKQHWMLVAAPLPLALMLVWFYSQGQARLLLEIPMILNGLEWQLTGMFAPLLGMTLTLWWLAGIYTAHQFATEQENSPHAARYLRCWLLALAGNLGLLLAADIASFYTLFALMTFSAYGLVIHSETREALRAGKVYIVMAVLGEGLLLTGLIWAAALVPGSNMAPLLAELPQAIAADSNGHWAAALLFAGFGVKAGLAGLHWWLPLAHPVAPTPASAVLSGAMIKAGLVGWLLTLPLGEFAVINADIKVLGWSAIILGLVGAWGAGVAGVCAGKAKAVLAYSSVSQMGLITTMLGIGLLYPSIWPAVFVAMLAFAVHHGINKGILFFGVGWRKAISAQMAPWLLLILAIPALNLIGVPWSSGEYAKDLFKGVLNELPQPVVYTLFSYAALATTALMLRFAWLLR